MSVGLLWSCAARRYSVVFLVRFGAAVSNPRVQHNALTRRSKRVFFLSRRLVCCNPKRGIVISSTPSRRHVHRPYGPDTKTTTLLKEGITVCLRSHATAEEQNRTLKRNNRIVQWDFFVRWKSELGGAPPVTPCTYMGCFAESVRSPRVIVY